MPLYDPDSGLLIVSAKVRPYAALSIHSSATLVYMSLTSLQITDKCINVHVLGHSASAISQSHFPNDDVVVVVVL